MAAMKTKRLEGVCDPLKCSDITLSERHKTTAARGSKCWKPVEGKSNLRFFIARAVRLWVSAAGQTLMETSERWEEGDHTSCTHQCGLFFSV